MNPKWKSWYIHCLFFSVLYKSSQCTIFGTKTCGVYNILYLLNYRVWYISEKNKQAKILGNSLSLLVILEVVSGLQGLRNLSGGQVLPYRHQGEPTLDYTTGVETPPVPRALGYSHVASTEAHP